MSKTYRYRDLSFAVADETEVIFTVEFISDGNTGKTKINVPGPIDPEIPDSGSIAIGYGSSLRGDTTVSVTNVANLIPEEEEIIIQYKINGKLLVEHRNLKSEEKRPMIVLFIKFPKP
jgi:hypothetical protein